ncbi:conserved Plasmodium protein, unknown function [Plasmodium gonderi]|uniref:Uncharacterized protein n=1 Tax=Plasmodium gonderi TaxID=77519 RepID=A0A1Y1JCS7_PLAGO|nr:conserved Plasmodium protein, unknown function [Plasmodium gonderi]GAW79007.1 conserved Plasmodium protein, unknown function [Plasmodium gonderi]
MNKSGEYNLFRQNGEVKLELHEMESNILTDLPTFSESPKINSEIYDSILKLDNRTEQKNYVYSGEKLSEFNFRIIKKNYMGSLDHMKNQNNEEDYQNGNGMDESDKNEENVKEQSIGKTYHNYATLKNTAMSKQSFEEIRMVDKGGFIQELIIDTHKNTLEHKKTNFLCLEEILKKMNLMLEFQIKINHSVASYQSERHMLFQHIYELKKQIADKAFNSLCNKDFTVRYVENAESKQKQKTYFGQIEPKNVEFQREEYHTMMNNEIPIKGRKSIDLFFSHLSELEKCVYSFTHFCRTVSSQSCIHEVGSIRLSSLEHGFFSFLRDPDAVRLIRDLEKNLTKIKSMCMSI